MKQISSNKRPTEGEKQVTLSGLLKTKSKFRRRGWGPSSWLTPPIFGPTCSVKLLLHFFFFFLY